MAKYDVVKEYDWTSAPRGSSIRKQAPRVWVKSYKLKSNQIMQMIRGYMNIIDGAGGDAKTFYDKMYGSSTTPEDDFNFPFFGDNVRSFSNTFGDTFQNGIGDSGGIGEKLNQGLKTFAGLGAQVLGVTDMKSVTSAIGQVASGDLKGAMNTIGNGGNPGSYVETPQFYQFDKNDNALAVSFVLSNTVNSDYDKNHKLVKKLTEINRPLRKNSIAVDPPRIYQVRVPGHRLIRWAYCSQFSVDFVGARRIIDNVIVPEGYQISMSFTSLTLEHAGFISDETKL